MGRLPLNSGTFSITSITMVVVSDGDVMHFLRTKEERQMKEKTLDV